MTILGGKMPASVYDPVSSALRLSLAADEPSNSLLDNRLISSARGLLLSQIDFEEAGDYQSNVLEGLKSKYVVIQPKKPDSKSPKKDGSNNSATSSEATDSLPTPKRTFFPIESVRLGWFGRDWEVGSGFQNVGNTCYLNSTLQALFHVPALVNWLMFDAHKPDQCSLTQKTYSGEKEFCVICSVRSTLVATQRSSSCIKPWQIVSKLRMICKHMMPGRQEDAHEFLRYLVEAMEKCYLSQVGVQAKSLEQYSKETTPLNQILGGYLRSAVRCLSCGHVSTTYQHFQDLLLDIRKAGSMDEALDLYFARERLEDLGYKCEACNKKVSATKQFFMERAPMVLCVAFKRFSLLGGKISKQIQYRKRITLNKYMFHKNKLSEDVGYKLVAMVTHLGSSQNCGHYTAIGQTSSGAFYQFDDSCVRPIGISGVLNTNAYIMFFEREVSNNNGNLPSSESPRMNKLEPSSTVRYGPHIPNGIVLKRENSPLKSNLERKPISFNIVSSSTSQSAKTNSNELKLSNGVNNCHVIKSEPLVVKPNGEVVDRSKLTLPIVNGETNLNGESPKKTYNFITKGSKLVNCNGSNNQQISNKSQHNENMKVTQNEVTTNGNNKTQFPKPLVLQTKSISEKYDEDQKSKYDRATSASSSSVTSANGSMNGHRNHVNLQNARLVPYDSESSGDERSSKEDIRPTRKSPEHPGKSKEAITSKATQYGWKVSQEDRPQLSPSSNGIVYMKRKDRDSSSSSRGSVTSDKSETHKNKSHNNGKAQMNCNTSNGEQKSQHSDSRGKHTCGKNIDSNGKTNGSNDKLNDAHELNDYNSKKNDNNRKINECNEKANGSNSNVKIHDYNGKPHDSNVKVNDVNTKINSSNGKINDCNGKIHSNNSRIHDGNSKMHGSNSEINNCSNVTVKNYDNYNKANNASIKIMNGASNGHMMGGHETLSKLQNLSHRGYGAPVSTWAGTHAALSRQVFEEKRMERKRAHEGEDEMDQGRTKKVKGFEKFSYQNQNRYNPFQDHQNSERESNNNNWMHRNRGSGGRRSFYNNYRRGNSNHGYKQHKRFGHHGNRGNHGYNRHR